MKKVFFLSFLLTLPFLMFSQTACNCCSENQKGFDFWVGEWEVSDTNNNVIGNNSIKKIESGCIINESWKGLKGYSGSSYNYFDKTDSTWNQLWIDYTGGHLKLKGKASSGKMVLRSELKKSKSGKQYYDQITWTKVSEDQVIQLWENYTSDGKKIAIAFKGIYNRKKD